MLAVVDKKKIKSQFLHSSIFQSIYQLLSLPTPRKKHGLLIGNLTGCHCHASPSIAQLQMANPVSQKYKKSNYYTITAFVFLPLFLLTIFFFSRRSLEPTLSAYRNVFYAGEVRHIDPISSELVDDSLRSSSSPTDLGIDSKIVNELLNSSTDLPLAPVSSDEQFRDSGINQTDVVGSSRLEENQTSVSGNNDEASSNEEDVAMGELKNCDLYMGKWVRDETYPIYKPGSCPYVDEAYACQSNGRPDSEYMKWRWKPDGCDLPRFNATDFLVRLRGKKLMLVGDSMNRNQFESILCVLREGLPDKSRMFETHGYKITKGRGYYMFKFVDYNCSVEFVRSHFLVKEGLRINGQGNSNPTLSIDKIDKTANKWKRADILVFNTGHWWTHGKTARGKNYYKEGDYIYPKFDAVEAYRRALKTWGSWIDNNLNPKKHLVMYRGYSSAHFRGGDWDSGGSCNGEEEPISEGIFHDTYPLKMTIMEEVIKQMRFPVVLLNVTRLTNFRKDGHPSIYGKNTTEGKKVSKRKQDCSHWCLPGVPDAWNELIYARLVLQQRVLVSNS